MTDDAGFSQQTARARFAELVGAVGAGDESIDVAEAALCIAAEHTPVDMQGCFAQLTDLAERARPGLEALAGRPLDERVAQFNQHMFRDEGFHGCSQADYYEPRNSFLSEVLANRCGIPITLSILYLEVASRLGLRGFGVGFPGHFLARIDADAEFESGAEIESDLDREVASADAAGCVVVDPFEGRVVSEEECVTRLRRALGPEAHFDSSWLRPATPREILVRVLGNLKHNYLAREQWADALACADRSLLVMPDSPLELRDRGILYQRLECFRAATDDLERFLELAPQHESAQMVRKSLTTLRGRGSTLH